MSDADEAFDLVVVGSGPGGYVAAIRGAQLGLRTAVIERDRLGGRCLNEACIPAKSLLRSADVVSQISNAGTFGINAELKSIEFSDVAGRRDQAVAGLTRGVGGLLKKNAVTVIDGTARFVAPSLLEVDGEPIHTGAVILATGSVPRSLTALPFGGPVVDTATAWTIDERPESMLVVGSGASGVELASAYVRLGTRVCLIEAADRIMPREDTVISDSVRRGLESDGVDVRTSSTVELSEVKGSGAVVRITDAEDEFELVVVAAGRRPDIDGLDLDAGGVHVDDAGMIIVDDRMRTTAARVWAIGDLVPGPALAHKASEEGIRAAEDVAGGDTQPLDPLTIPRATFCHPPVASVGLTEEEARRASTNVRIGAVPYSAVGASAVLGENGQVKLIGDGETGEVLGAHIVGHAAPELLSEVVMTRVLEGGTPELATSVHGHPTLTEAISEAARAAEGWVIHG